MKLSDKVGSQTNYVQYLIKSNARYLTIMVLLYIVSNPVITVILMNFNDNYYTSGYFGIVFNTIVFTVSPFIVGNLLFSYKTSKKGVDVYHALPISRVKLFTANYISGLILLILPYIFSFILSSIFNYVVLEYSLITSLSFMLRLIPITLMIYGIVVFAQMNTGTSVDGLLYGIVLVVLPLMFVSSIHLHITNFVFGISGYAEDIVYMISPFADIFRQCISYVVGSNSGNNTIYWLFMFVVISLFNGYLYKKMKSEVAGTVFSNKVFSIVIHIIISIVIELLVINIMVAPSYEINLSNVMLFSLSVLSVVIYNIIIQGIAKRTLNKIYSSLAQSLVVAVVIYGVIWGADQMNYFNISLKVPQNVTKVVINTRNEYQLLDSDYSNLEFEGEELQLVQEFHQLILDAYEEVGYEEEKISDYKYESLSFNEFDSPTSVSGFNIEYYYKDNNLVRYSYKIPSTWVKYFDKISYTEEMFNARYKFVVGNEIKDEYINSAVFQDAFSESIDINESISYTEFIERYKNDYLSLNGTSYYDTNYEYLGEIVFWIEMPTDNFELGKSTKSIHAERVSMPLDNRFVNTVDYLEQCNIEINRPINEEIKGVIFYPDENDKQDSQYYLLPPEYEGIYGNIKYSDLSSEQINEIRPYLIPRGVSDVQTYIVVINDGIEDLMTKYLVNPEYLDLVKEIIENNEVYSDKSYYEIISEKISNY